MARLQLQIFEGLSRVRDTQKPRVQEALARLNSELVDITTVSSACPHELTQPFFFFQIKVEKRTETECSRRRPFHFVGT